MANDLRNLTVRLSLDRLNFDQGLSGVNRALNTLRGELTSTQSGMGGFENESERVSARVDALTRLIQAQEEKVRILRQSYDQAAQATGEDSRATQIYAGQVNRAVAELGRLQGELAGTTEQLNRMETSSGSLGRSMEGFGNKLQNAGMQIGAVFGSIALVVGGALKNAISTGSEFESEMAKVGAKAGASAEEMKKLSTTAQQLAPLAGGATNAATAMDDLAAKGYSVNQIIQAMPGILSAANASGEDLALTSDTITSALETFKLKATDTNHVADVLAQTANLTAAGMSDLQNTFKYAAAPAAALGISMEQLAAMTGIMANQGIKGEQAGTSLREAMLRLVNPPKEAAAELKDLGVKVTDNQGKFRNFSDIIGELNNSTSKMTNAQKTAALAHIFGTNAVSGMLAVISGGKPKIDQFTDSLVHSDGASKKAADSMQNNFAGSMKKLNGALDAAKISIEQALAPALKTMADYLQKLVTSFNNLSPGMKQFIAISLAVTAIVATIGVAFGGFLAATGAIISAMGVLGGALGGLGAIFAVITGPIGITIAIVAGLVAIFVTLWKNNETFRDKVKEIWGVIQNVFSISLNFIMNIVHAVMTNVMSFVGDILGKLQSFWSQHGSEVMTIVQSSFNFVWNYIQNTMNFIKGIFQVVWPLISGIVITAWAVIKTSIKTAFDLILGIISVALDILTGHWDKVWGDLKSTAKNIWNDIVNTFKGIDLFQVGKDIINGLINGVKSMVGAVGSIMSDIGKSIVSVTKNVLGIHSPSRVMMELGGYVSDGFAIGMGNNAHKVLAASNNLSNAAMPNVGQSGPLAANGSGMGRSGINVTVNTQSVDMDEYQLVRTLQRMEALYG